MNKNYKQVLLIFIFIGLLFFPLITNAQGFWSSLLSVFGLDDFGNSVFNALSAFLVQMLANIATGIPNAALQFLSWVTSPDFLKVSMTNSGLVAGEEGYNGLVGEGWGITRNLANIALIFGLVVIAINIIIGNQEVQAKKALVNFVLIAILINFTPVICGVIIDASNALTSYFLTGGIRGDLVNFLAEEIRDNKDIDFVALIVFFFFGIFSAVIYLLYALLFAARYIMLWILIIVSPLAFASKVFPKSRYITKFFPSSCYWDEWWEQFIQWNVIGIPAGLFIYLSNVAMVNMAGGGMFDDASGISIFGKLFGYAMPFIFMVIGFFMTMSSGGAVGAKISGVGKQIWSKTGAAAVGAGIGAGVATGKYAKERTGALATYTKEGLVGRGAAMISNIGKDKDEKINWRTRDGREEGRQKYRDFKKGIKEKAAKYGIVSHENALEKPKAEKKAEETVKNWDIDYFNKHQGDITTSSEVRKAGDIKFMKQDPSAYLKGAGTDKTEYQRRLKNIHIYGDNSKEHTKIKTKALMDAQYKNKGLAGSTNWEKLYNIKLEQEMQNLSPKDLRDSASPEFLKDHDSLGALSSNQINYLLSQGSKTQADAVKETQKWYTDPNKKHEVKNYIDNLYINRDMCLSLGDSEGAKKYQEQIKKAMNLYRTFN